jgi:hypothetical protein
MHIIRQLALCKESNISLLKLKSVQSKKHE